jgi:hypothetical protein
MGKTIEYEEARRTLEWVLTSQRRISQWSLPGIALLIM